MALEAYVSTKGAVTENERLQTAMDRVCSEAHKLGMTPEAMVIAVRAAYESVVAVKRLNDAMLRNAYDRLLSGCIQAYFEEQARPKL